MLTLAKCYATLANDGQCNEVGFIKKIYNENGLIYSREQQNDRVFRSGANYLMTDMLVNTVETGTARVLKNARYQIAAKTGTVGNSDGNSDALVAGYTTENTFVFWYSGELPNNVNGSTAPCEFASRVLSEMYAETAPAAFVPPSTVVRLDVDKHSLYDNQLVVRTVNGEKFWFDKNNQPKELLSETRYDYRLNVNCDGNTVHIFLPQTDGKWQLYRLTDGTAELLPIDGDAYTEEIVGDAEYYAELYLNNRLVYTTPKAQVHRQNRRQDDPPRTDFPDLTDFWYWG